MLQVTMPQVTVVVPCYNEAERLDPAEFLRLARQDGLSVLFVNDGSRDGTEDLLRDVCDRSSGRASWLSLEHNSGKAEAVRRGLLQALQDGPAVVAYLDADLSTPVDELLRLADLMRERADVHVVLGSRVRLLGNAVERKAIRHYLGRVFATAASLALGLAVYDTQCGAKLFRASPTLRAALDIPFETRWIFDVELLARLLFGAQGQPALTAAQFLEVPLRTWRDVAGSKLRLHHMARAASDLARIHLQLRHQRARRDLPGPADH
jgi:dolichyl-phosphate beta-glucosyltransferase